MNPAIIPSIDPIALPAPVWVMQFLSALTFVLHVFPMNLVLGGGIIAAVIAWNGRRKERADHIRLARQISHVLPAATALTITFGVPPLLFLQVLYGPLFYSSSVIMAWPWLAVIGLLILAYYGYYYFSMKKDADGYPPVWSGFLASGLFIVIGFIFSNNMVLMIQPEKFGTLYHENAHGLMLNLRDPMLWPRYLHFFVGALAVSSLLIMVIGLISRKDRNYSAMAIRLGGLGFVIATIVQFGVGIWLLLSLRRPVMMLFMGQNLAATILFGVAFFLAIVAMILILVAALGTRPVGATIAGIATIAVTIILMTLIRAIVRDAYLGANFVVTDQPVSPQWLVVGIFFALLVAGLGMVLWMVRAVVTYRGVRAR